MRKLALVIVIVAACKGDDRKQMCKVALQTFEDGWKPMLTTQKDPAIKSKMEVALKRVQEQFPAYCESAPQEDIDCISRGTEMMNDPKCKRALDAMKKMFAVE